MIRSLQASSESSSCKPRASGDDPIIGVDVHVDAE